MYLLDTHTLLWALFNESIERIAQICKSEGFYMLSIKPSHLDHLKKLPQIHGDPFDRLIISQATIEELTIVTKDAKLPAYGIKTLW